MWSAQLAAHEFGRAKKVVKIAGVELRFPSPFLGGTDCSFLHTVREAVQN